MPETWDTRSGLDPDLSFVEPRAATLRTLTRFGQSIRCEHESALFTPGRLDDHTVPGRFGRSNRVVKIILDITAIEPELTRDG
jgi:hypothetical protein